MFFFNYPPQDILAEIGRVAVASARLDQGLGALWHELDPDRISAEVALEHSVDVAAIKKAAGKRLNAKYAAWVTGVVDDCDEFRRRRNKVVHQMLRLDFDQEEGQAASSDPRGSIDSANWVRFHKHDKGAALQPLEELVEIETGLRERTTALFPITLVVNNIRLGSLEGRRGSEPW